MANERYLVVKEESEFGVAETPDKYIDILGESLGYDPGVTPVETVFSRDIRKHVNLKALLSGDVDFNVEPENVAHFFKWALGSCTSEVIGETTVYKHLFKPADTLKSFTAIIAAVGEYPAGNFRKDSGCLVNGLHLESALDILKGNITVVGAKEEKDATFTPTSPVPISALDPFVFHQATLTLASADKSQYLRKLTLDIGNNIPTDDLYGHGSPNIRRAKVDRRTVGVELEMAFEDNTDYDKMLAGTEVAADLHFLGPVADDPEKYELKIDLPKMIYKSGTAHIVGRDPLVVAMPCEVFYDSVSGYEVMIELHNKVASY